MVSVTSSPSIRPNRAVDHEGQTTYTEFTTRPGKTPVNERTIRRALDRAHKRGYRDQIAGACFAHAATQGDVSLVLYDVTTLYFEAEKEDDLRKVCLLRRKGIEDQSIESLVEQNMDNVLALFRDFNNGTHGHAGRFTITQLNALRIRVESAIGFIHALCTV